MKPTGPTCRGGGTIVSPSGYVMEYARDHPGCGKAGRVEQHRLVMECLLGRLLARAEIVHHKNRIRHDNRAENLEVLDRPAHGREHAEETRQRMLADLDERRVQAALRERTTLQAARLLGVNHQTLRNRFGHLLAKRRSPGQPFPKETVERVRAAALDPTMGTIRASRLLGLSQKTIRACCLMHGIEWIAAPLGRPSRKRLAAGGGR